MQMLDRYLHAIAFWLPKDQREDILAEISEDLNSQIEDQQTALGRDLNPAEFEELLKRRGRPFRVASQYRPQQSLIGPVWFPAYVFVLKIVGLCYVLPWLIVFVIVHRVQHPALNWGMTLLAAWATIWTVAFFAAGMVTLIFTILQLAEKRTNFLENWNPRKLPPVRDPYKIPLSTSIADLVANVVFLLWWMAFAWSPFVFNRPGFRLTLAPVWTYFFWGYVALALLHIVLAAANLRRRYWNGLRAAFRLVLDLTGGVLFCWLLKAHLGATIYVGSVSSAETLTIRNALHLGRERMFPIAVIVVAIVAVVDLIRIVRVNGNGEAAAILLGGPDHAKN